MDLLILSGKDVVRIPKSTTLHGLGEVLRCRSPTEGGPETCAARMCSGSSDYRLQVTTFDIGADGPLRRVEPLEYDTGSRILMSCMRVSVVRGTVGPLKFILDPLGASR